MSVYKEFFAGISHIETNSSRIFPDAADFGALSNKGDETWNWAAQLAEWYGNPDTKKVYQYETGATVEIEIEGLDEWAVSDRRKTMKEAQVKCKLVYVQSTALKRTGYAGYFYIQEL